MAYFLATVRIQIFNSGNPTINRPAEMRLVEAESREEAERKVRACPLYTETFRDNVPKYGYKEVHVAITEAIR